MAVARTMSGVYASRMSQATGFDLAEGIEVLERTPATLRALLGGLSPAWIRANEGGETFTAFDVVGHLIDGEETDWIPRARIILAQGPNPRFEPFDRFRHRSRNEGRALHGLLDEFERLRAANVAALRGMSLTPADLALQGIHPELGSVTLEQLLATWVAHDLDHVYQVARVMAKRYTAAAGPWTAYIKVLRS